MYRPNTIWTWAFLLVVFVQAVVGLSLEAYVFARFQRDLSGNYGQYSASKTIPTYLSLLIFGFIYELVLVYDALWNKNTIQVIGLCLYNVGILVYVSIETGQVNDAIDILLGNDLLDVNFWNQTKGFLIAVAVVVGVTTVLMAGIAWKLYDEFAWTIYKKISADVRMKRRYLIYQIYIALLKFDFFFFLGFTVQFLVIVSNTTNGETGLTIAAIPVTIIILIGAALFVRRENLMGHVFVIFWFFVALAYFLFKLVRMYASSPSRIRDYLPARRSLTSFAVITVMLVVCTLTFAFWCMANFNKGLKEYVMPGKSPREDEDSKMYLQDVEGGGPGSPNKGTGPSRMIID